MASMPPNRLDDKRVGRDSKGACSASPESLSLREQEVLRWLCQGKTNWEIGQILGISALTVKNHVRSILKKLNVGNRTQAVALTLREES